MSRARRDPVAVALNIGLAITSSLNLDVALQSVARGLAEAFAVGECDLFAYLPEDEALVAVACWAREATAADADYVGTVERLRLHPAHRLLIESGQPRLDLVSDPGLDPIEREAMLRWGELSDLWVPLQVEDEVVGAMVLCDNRQERTYSSEEMELLRMVVHPAACAVQNARTNRHHEDERRRISALLESTRAISSTMVLDDVLPLVAQNAAQAVGVPLVYVYQYDSAVATVHTQASFGAGSGRCAADPPGNVCPLAQFPGGRELLDRGQISELRLDDPALAAAARASMRRWGEKAILNVPFIAEGVVLGFLAVIETRYERHFNADEVQLVQAFGDQIGIAVRNAQLREANERRTARLTALLRSSRAISSKVKLDEVLETVARVAAEVLGCDECQIQAYDREADTVTPVAMYQRVHDPRHLESLGRAFPLADYPADREMIAQRNIKEEHFSDADLAAMTRQTMLKYGDHTYLNVPLMHFDEAIGVLVLVQATEERHFSDDEREIAAAIAEQAAVAIVNARLVSRIEAQAITDGLTGLYNHRYFYDRLDQEVARAQRYGSPLSLLMLDLDDFKRFNDHYGHVAGDEALREVGRILRAQVRRNVDLAARYGGEEFVVLLPNTTTSKAEIVGARLYRALEQLRLDDFGGGVSSVPVSAGASVADTAADGSADSPGADDVAERISRAIAATSFPVNGSDGSGRLTASIGVASYPFLADSASELVAHADVALYVAKRKGKNRVEVYGD
jgi:diguanylate cyclase (GGDEF)-like protein